MPRLKVATTLDAPPERVWADIEDIASHVEWMQDAVAIEFTSDIDSGVGTTFDCATRIGPFRLTDHMEITSWRPGREMGVRHVGMVTGSGAFTLTPVRSGRGRRRRDRTRFVWTERLKFPWYFGGPIGAVVARPVLRQTWRRTRRGTTGPAPRLAHQPAEPGRAVRALSPAGHGRGRGRRPPAAATAVECS